MSSILRCSLERRNDARYDAGGNKREFSLNDECGAMTLVAMRFDFWLTSSPLGLWYRVCCDTMVTYVPALSECSVFTHRRAMTQQSVPNSVDSTPLYRVRFVLEATRDFRVPARQGALIYAFLASANRTEESPAAFPRDLLIDVPEDNRTVIKFGESYALGGTLLANSPAEATAVVHRLRTGIDRLGREGKPRRDGLGGNFSLLAVQDLVAGVDLTSQLLMAVRVDVISREIQALLGRDEITLEFLSPLRLERPGNRKQSHESFFDRRFFDAPYFIRRLLRRMATVGLQARSDSEVNSVVPEAVHVVWNRLVWLDLAYGGPQGKSLGGAVGLVRLKILPGNDLFLAALVWGQWTRVGKNTHFGFGRYRIVELGAEPCTCSRGVSLLSTAWTHPLADSLSAKAGLESGALSQVLRDLDAKTYVPHAPALVTIDVEPNQRQLQVPSRRDRLLQRLVLESIGPALDSLFESSSFAWRRGLGRHSSARAVSKAFRQGYRFAVNADFDRFFETIDHAALEDRLRAYVADRETIELILLWVKSAMRGRTQGIPTGAPLSPILGNLFLDEFDERIAQNGGRLIRYGDDFLILCRSEEQARGLLNVALSEAQSVKLRLNEMADSIIPLDEPFTFLGLRFEHHDQWQITAGEQVRLVEELGWKEASATKVRRPLQLQLAGETGTQSGMGLTAIVGPGATHLEWRPGELRCHYTQGREPTEIPLAGLETLVVLGRLGISAEILQKICEHSVNVVLAEDRGLAFGWIGADESVPSALLVAQVNASQRTATCLDVARTLIVTKLYNYRRLAEALPRRDASLISTLKKCEEQSAQVGTIEELRGVEGYAAATWYQSLRQHLGQGFTFERRVAPDAEDPVNVLLNIAHTLVYRMSMLSIRAAGMASSLGFLHQPTTRFAALAADLQEPFRFLMDRVVIEATHVLRPKDFTLSSTGPYPVMIAPDAARQFQLMLWKSLSLTVAPLGDEMPIEVATQTAEVDHPVNDTVPFDHAANSGQSAMLQGQPASYRIWIERQSRQLRRYLLQQSPVFQPFQLP